MKQLHKISLLALLMLVSGAAQAVKISRDGTGQVLLFPFMVADSSNETSITIRNHDSVFGKALRLVVKDPINGRPTLAINLYLRPGDRWTGTLTDPNDSGPRTAVGHLLPWGDDNCTFPAAAQFGSKGLALDDAELLEDFGSLETINRLSTGSVEVYEMGTITAALAADCGKIERRWSASFGAWNQDPVGQTRNQGVAPPTGGISGEAVWADTGNGMAFRYAATVLDEFRESPLHTHPDFARSPSLIDVSPAVSKVLVRGTGSDGLFMAFEQVTNWSQSPIHAIDALLMTQRLRVEYESRSDLFLPVALVAMPTFAYHNDLDGYYLDDPADRVATPFSDSSAISAGAEAAGEPIVAEALNAVGERHTLQPAGDAALCGQYRVSLTPILLTNIINFSHRCELGQAELRIWAQSSKAELDLSFSGEIRSDEGLSLSGLPVQGVLFQSVRGRLVDGGTRKSWGWSTPMRRD